MMAKTGKILFLQNQSSKIDTTCTDLSMVEGLGVEAKSLSKFLEDSTFATDFGGEVV